MAKFMLNLLTTTMARALEDTPILVNSDLDPDEVPQPIPNAATTTTPRSAAESALWNRLGGSPGRRWADPVDCSPTNSRMAQP